MYTNCIFDIYITRGQRARREPHQSPKEHQRTLTNTNEHGRAQTHINEHEHAHMNKHECMRVRTGASTGVYEQAQCGWRRAACGWTQTRAGTNKAHTRTKSLGGCTHNQRPAYATGGGCRINEGGQYQTREGTARTGAGVDKQGWMVHEQGCAAMNKDTG